MLDDKSEDNVSIHALHMECDAVRFNETTVLYVSIHALHMECDSEKRHY
jgi:hypothetical protein